MPEPGRAAITVRSRLLLNRERSRGNLFDAMSAQFSHVPPPPRPVSQAMRVTPTGRALRGARWLDLCRVETRLIRLSPESPVVRVTTEPVSLPPGERLLVLEAERILASRNARGPAQGPSPGEIITVLTEAGAITANSPVPGQLAALGQRLGVAGGVTRRGRAGCGCAAPWSGPGSTPWWCRPGGGP